jgi:hypothetical protein
LKLQHFLRKIVTMTEESTPLIVADATKGIKVNAGVIAKPYRDEIKAKVQSMVKQGIGTSVQWVD